jgi:hypothetical protein
LSAATVAAIITVKSKNLLNPVISSLFQTTK